jgi:dGTP triphosphohydrolase
MHYKTFDTHKYIKNLQETGFNEQQAEILVKSLLESRDFDLSILATREQVAEVKSDLQKNIAQLDSKLSKEISEVKSDLQKEIATTREQISEVKSDLQKDIAQLDSKLSKEIAATREQISEVKDGIRQSKIDMLKWIFPMFITILIAIFFKR